MANSIAADASDLAMVNIMKIGGVLNAMGKADAASLPLSSHTFTEHLDIAGGVLTERCSPTTEW